MDSPAALTAEHLKLALPTLTWHALGQVGTSDGRIKLLGTGCMEVTLTSPEQTATKSLHILANTGCLLRLDTAGGVDLWSISTARRVQHLMPPPGDAITVLCPLPHDPYVLAGCRSGALRVLGLVGATSEPSTPASTVTGLRWMHYTAQPEDLGAPDDCPVGQIAVTNDSSGHVRVALLHEGHAVTLWALHSRQVRAPHPSVRSVPKRHWRYCGVPTASVAPLLRALLCRLSCRQ
jgi:hypothetical protein